ncbi:MAG TPA: OmpH family outer membrane protein, partial [Woeseiaceae bacterium]|nr:OmpH family outer membrane protein [Woeseiaceae bacterium]
MIFVQKRFLRAFAAVALMSVVSLPLAAQEVKIGVVNVTALMEQAPQAKAAMDALQEEFAPRQRTILAKQQELEDLSEKANRDAAVMGETERRNMEKDLRDLQREVARMQTEFR